MTYEHEYELATDERIELPAFRKLPDGIDLAIKGETTSPRTKSMGATVSGKLHPDDGQPKVEISPLDEWENDLTEMVDPEHPNFEKNIVRRQITAQTRANELRLRVSPDQVRARLVQKQRDLIAGTEAKGISGGDVAQFALKEWLIEGLIAKGCLTAVAAFAKVGKTKFLTEIAASLIHQRPFMGNPEWQPAPGKHQLILWWTDQPGTDTAGYLRAAGLMDSDGTLHPQIIRLYTEDDGACWDDQGIDLLIQDTATTPGCILLTDSFFRNIQPIYGDDQNPGAGGALIDVQTFLSKATAGHVCTFHSPQETGPVGVNAMRGHGSAKGVPSAVISLHFLERKDPTTGKFVADKESPYRRMVTEGRMPYSDLLVKLDGASGRWEVIGKFDAELARLTAGDQKQETIDNLTDDQKATLEWVGVAAGIWKEKVGVTIQQVAAAKVQPRQPTGGESEVVRKQLKSLVKKGLLTEKNTRPARYSYRP